MMPEAVSTCGANTSSGRVSRMVATTSSIGGGANGACRPAAVGRAFSTADSAGMQPASKIWVQRKLNQPLRMTRHLRSVANCRATASMPNVPLPGTTMAAWAAYARLRMAEMSFITR